MTTKLIFKRIMQIITDIPVEFLQTNFLTKYKKPSYYPNASKLAVL